MSNNETNTNNTIDWGTKAKYIGTGIVIGVIVAPLVKKALNKIQPKMDEWVDQLTGKTEEVAEKAADLLARAKDHFHSEDHRQANE